MKKIKYFLILLVLFISISAVSADDGNFTSLQTDITTSTGSIELTQDYVYDNTTDSELKNGIFIKENNFVVNGNGHTIDGSNQSRIFLITGSNVTLKNLNLINGNNKIGGAILSNNLTNFENVTFTGNTAEFGAAIVGTNHLIIENSNFTDNHAEKGVVYSESGNLEIENSLFANTTGLKFSMVYATGALTINDCVFVNATSKYATAVYSSGKTKIKDSVFSNLSAEFTAGAVAFKGEKSVEIEDTIFINTHAEKNGGAIFGDFSSDNSENASFGLTLTNVSVMNASGDYGGAICNLGGILIIENSTIIENTAEYGGGAIYTSNARFGIFNSLIAGNKINRPDYGNGGGIYLDYSQKSIFENNKFMNNTKNAIYIYDSNFEVVSNIFENNGEAIHAVFAGDYEIKDNDGEDTINLNNTDYITLVDETGAKIELNGSNITIKDLPVKFDARDYNWTSSVKNQGDMGSCWTFGTCGALEAALKKATGIEYDFSENNMQNSMLQYSKYGVKGSTEGGSREQGLVYIISWMGVLPTEADAYDELGKISPLIDTGLNIHIQDALFVPSRENATDNDALKRAIIECGSVTTGYYAYDDAPYFNKNTSAYYQNNMSRTNHAISLVGWDDNYSASNFAMKPAGDGAFIIKNSWGTDSGIDGYYYISYYDTSLLNTTFAIGFIINNTENYTKNYQTDLGGELSRSSLKEYKVTYESEGNDTISAVGTYFDSNEDYTLEIYVNNELMHTQNGTSPFNGFHTVKLTKGIQVKEGDNFTALMKKDSAYLLEDSRQHYQENTTYILVNDTWKDLASDKMTVSLKVFTKNSDATLQTEDLVKIYKNESQFYAVIDAANQTVIFEINNQNYTRTSNASGVAGININLNPGKYSIKTTYGNITALNTIEVLPTLIADNLVKIFKNQSQFYISLIDKSGYYIPNTPITMNINGVFYNRTTNENGTAKLNINLIPGEYVLTATDPLTSLQMSYNITVLPTLIADNLVKYFRNESQFYISLFDSEGNAVPNTAITMNINGVFYNRTTNENGTAKLNINLIPGEYVLTATDPLTGLQMSYKITVLPVLTAEDLTMQYKDGSQFKATLVDGQGKALSGAKIQFNVNGVFYYRTTNDEGVAALNINLMAGEYIITSQYENAAISNKITISA